MGDYCRLEIFRNSYRRIENLTRYDIIKGNNRTERMKLNEKETT